MKVQKKRFKAILMMLMCFFDRIARIKAKTFLKAKKRDFRAKKPQCEA